MTECSVPASMPMLTSFTRSEEHTSELQSHSDLHSFPTRRSSDLIGPGEKIEERGLPRAVRADDGVQRAGLDADAHVVHGGQGAERLAQVFCFEDCHNRDQASTTPPRKKSTTITNATPSRSGQRAHSVLTDSESQMKTNEPMIGP